MSEQHAEPSFMQTFLSAASAHARETAASDFACQAHGLAAWYHQTSQMPSPPKIRTIIERLPEAKQGRAWRIVDRLTNRERAIRGVKTTPAQAITRLQTRLATLTK